MFTTRSHPGSSASGGVPVTPPFRILLLLAVALVTSAGARVSDRVPTLHIDMDLVPDDPANVVDPLHGDRVPVAVLARPGLDVRSIDPDSLRLAGVPASKDEAGSLTAYGDLNGDGREDLLVGFPESALAGIGEPARARLAGRLRDGTRWEGSDRFRTIQDLRMKPWTRAAPSRFNEKLSPLPVAIDVMPADNRNLLDPTRGRPIPVAILGKNGFDVESVSPATINLAGSPITRGDHGRWVQEIDVDGDGRLDLVVHIASSLLRRSDPGPHDVELRALTRDGRPLLGRDRISTLAVRTVTLANDKPLSASGPVIESANNGSIVINDNAPATPFPSTITLSPGGSVRQWVGKLRVTLKGLSHSFPADLDVMLVGPDGQSVLVMSDAGGGSPGVTGVNVTFDDDAPEYLSQVANPASGIYRPTNYDDGLADAFPMVPAPSRSAALSAFNGSQPAGTWSLYVMDDQGADVGTIASGWSIELLLLEELCYFPDNNHILIPDNQPYSLYPASVSFAAQGVVSKAMVEFDTLDHPFPEDLDLLVESPSGQAALVLSDAGGSNPVDNVTVRLDDDAPTVVSDSSLTNGAFRPFDYDDGVLDFFGGPAPPGPYSSKLSSLIGSPVAGNWNFYLKDDAASGGAAGSLFGLCIGLSYVTPSANTSVGAITVPQGSPGATSGPGSPYPSTVQITGMYGVISKVTVEIQGLTHTFPADLDVLLAGPGGQGVVLMSDAGGGTDVAGLDFMLDDAAASALPEQAALTPGTYRPANYAGADPFPMPAPPAPYGAALAALNGIDPNGTWTLFVVDDATGDVGSVTSWKLNITTVVPSPRFCNFAPLTIPAGAPGATSGPASPYPSTINVTGLDFPAGRIKVLLNQVSHTFPSDLDLLLVGPQAQNLLFMSDAGGGVPASGISLSLEDEGSTPLPGAGGLTSGAFAPVNHFEGDADIFPGPAPPASSKTTFLDAFAGTDPNGAWRLYVNDDAGGDYGSITSWCLEIWPLFVPAGDENHHLRWQDSTTLVVPDAVFQVNGVTHNLYRGELNQLPALLDPNVDSCRRATSVNTFSGLTESPPAGGIYWYLSRVANSGGDEGSAGLARTASGFVTRVHDSSGPCP
jgi:subtilisin-like proprotein convertase family protein